MFLYNFAVLETYEYINPFKNYLQMKDVNILNLHDGWDYEGFLDTMIYYIPCL